MPKGKINLARELTDELNLIENPELEKLEDHIQWLIQKCLDQGDSVKSIKDELMRAKNISVDLADPGKKMITRQRLGKLFDAALEGALTKADHGSAAA